MLVTNVFVYVSTKTIYHVKMSYFVTKRYECHSFCHIVDVLRINF